MSLQSEGMACLAQMRAEKRGSFRGIPWDSEVYFKYIAKDPLHTNLLGPCNDALEKLEENSL